MDIFMKFPHQDHVTASLRLTATRVNGTKYRLIFQKVKCLFSLMTASGAALETEAENVRNSEM